jgi:iron complex transport system substrate-binding protein
MIGVVNTTNRGPLRFVTAFRRARLFEAARVVSIAVVTCAGGAHAAEEAAAAARIVSVGGPITETVFALGAGAEVVGVDTTSLWPAEANALPRVGYLRTLSSEGIASLRPTLVVAAAEAGPPQALEQLAGVGVRVEKLGAEHSIEGTKQMIRRLGELLGRARESEAVAAKLQQDVDRAKAESAVHTGSPRVLFVVAPPGVGAPLAAGTNTPVDAIITLAGGSNAAAAIDGYKPLTPEAAAAASPDVVLTPSGTLERAGGDAAFLERLGLAHLPAGKSTRVVEVEPYVVAFGPRTGEALAKLAPTLHGSPSPNTAMK